MEWNVPHQPPLETWVGNGHQTTMFSWTDWPACDWQCLWGKNRPTKTCYFMPMVIASKAVDKGVLGGAWGC